MKASNSVNSYCFMLYDLYSWLQAFDLFDADGSGSIGGTDWFVGLQKQSVARE